MHPTIWKFTHRRNGEIIWQSDWIENALTDEGEEAILNTFFAKTVSPPTNFYIGMVNDTPAETDTLASLTGEPSTGGYARKVVTFSAAAIDAGDYQAQSTTVNFAPSGASIGPVTHQFLTDVVSGTSGLLIAYVALGATRTILEGDDLDVAIAGKLS